MLLHPEVQKRAQEELDQAVGKDVLPSLDDRPNLPYLDAVIKETFRFATSSITKGDEFDPALNFPFSDGSLSYHLVSPLASRSCAN